MPVATPTSMALLFVLLPLALGQLFLKVFQAHCCSWAASEPGLVCEAIKGEVVRLSIGGAVKVSRKPGELGQLTSLRADTSATAPPKNF